MIRTLADGDVFGELALLTGEVRSASAVTRKDTRVWVILKEHFDRLLDSSPALAQAVRHLAANRIDLSGATARQREIWARVATRDLEDKIAAPTEAEVKEAARASRAVPLAIFLGMLLDGIPESLVIGSRVLQAQLSLSLLAALFLSNFPEALGSSVGMRQQDYPRTRIVAMWVGLMLLTGVGAHVGAMFLTDLSTTRFALMGGVAAGAMLTMIAETMLPEAYHKGGAITGVSTLLGFLAAIFFKTLE